MYKPRILLISYTVPENKMGGALILYRHFLLNQDFELGVVTNSGVTVPNLFFRDVREPCWLNRLKRTRFSLWVEDYTHLIHARISDRRLLKAAKEFKPDIIFNVAETYLSYQAQIIARELGIPFVAYFMDWATYCVRSHRWVTFWMDNMYRRLYRRADLAFCICEGMKKELGPHRNSHVLYPIAADVKLTGRSAKQTKDCRFLFCFAGNLNLWYGQMVRDLIQACEGHDLVGLRVFGTGHNWTKSFVDDQFKKGVFGGFRPFDQLIPVFESADAFLLPMGFGGESALIERTSFKTKLLDYILFEKPILVWGPEYSTAVEIAKKYKCAYCVTDADPRAVMAGMQTLAKNVSLRQTLVKNATLMRQSEMNCHKVHSTLKTQLEKLLQR